MICRLAEFVCVKKGGHGGHNGIKSLITHLGTKEFKRVRIGIGRPMSQMAVVDYVLQRFQKDEIDIISKAVEQAADACEAFIRTSFDDAMNHYNQAH